MSRPLLAAALAAASSLAAQLGDPADRLARALGDPDFATREKASSGLRKIGPAALPAVRRAATSPDPEARHRAAALLPGLEAQAALTPTRVVLPAGATLDEALAAIARQTGYKLTADDPLGDTRHDLGAGPVAFWQAVDRISELSGRAVTADDPEDGVRLTGDLGRSPFIALDGAFRVHLNDMDEARDVDFEPPPKASNGAGRPAVTRSHKLTLNLTVLAEPRFAIYAAGPAQVTAVDDAGGRLAAVPDKGKGDDPDRGPPSPEVRLAVGLRRSPRAGVEIRTLSGVVPVGVVVDRKPVAVPDYRVAAGTTVRVVDAAVKVQSAGVDEDGDLRVVFRVAGGGRVPAEWWEERVFATDLRGRRLTPSAPDVTRDGGEYEVDVSFDAPGGWLNTFGPRLVFEDWVVVEKRVAFTFRGVPLP